MKNISAGIIFCWLLILIPSFLQAQTRTTVQPGDWNLTATWGVALPSEIPTAANSDSIIVNHAVTIPGGFSVTVDGMRISLGTSVTVNTAGTLTVANVPTALKVQGTLIAQNSSIITVTAASDLLLTGGATYQHQFTTTEGTIPLATWGAATNLLISGYTTATTATAGGNWGQNFGNVTWNSTAQTAAFDLGGLLNSVQGDLSFQSTGTQFVTLTSLAGADALSIGRDLIVGGTARVSLSTGATSNFTITVARDVLISTSNYLRFSTDGISTINVGRNVDITSGTITEVNNGTGNFRFVNSATHTFRRGTTGIAGTLSGRINYEIGASDILDLATAVLHNGGTSANANTFNLQGTIRLGAIDVGGALQNSTVVGNIRTSTANRTFASGSTVVYNGVAPQFINNGNGAPTAAGTTTIINNASGVTLASNLIVNGALQLQSGTLSIAATRNLFLNGTVVTTGGFLGGTPTSSLTIGGTTGGALGSLSFNPAENVLGTLTMNRTGASASATLASSLSITSQVNLTAGDFINNGAMSLDNGVTVTRYSSSQLLNTGFSNLAGDSYNLTYRSTGPIANFSTGLEMPPALDTEDLSNLTINTANSTDTVQLAHDIIINSSLTLTRGRLYVQAFTITFEGNAWNDNLGNLGYGTGRVIFNSDAAIQGTSASTFYHIQVNSGRTVTFLRNTSIYGNVDYQAGSVVDGSTITYSFSGGDEQTISANGNTFSNIIVTKTNGADITLTSPMNLSGILRFNAPSASVDLHSDGFLTLLSTTDAASASLGTAMIYRLLSSNTVSGNVTVQRYMSGEGRIYRYISTPVSGAFVSQWKDDFYISGNFNDPTPAIIVCGFKIDPAASSLFYYDETQPGALSSGYVGYPSPGTSTANSPIVVGQGYATFIRQCTNPTVVDVTGPINQQAISLPVTYTLNDATAQGWNLVGNPYPCSIDWDIAGSTGWTKTRMSSTIAILDNGAGGVFRYWDGDGTPNDIPNGVIAVGQAFWVRATAANPILTIREGVKALEVPEFFRAPAPKTPTLILTLDDGEFSDRAYIKIRTGAKAALDKFDAPKMDNAIFDLSSVSSDNMSMAINATDNVACGSSFKLITKDLKKGTFTFRYETIGKFGDFGYELRDKFTGSTTRLTTDGYTFDVTTDPLSAATDRFSITLVEKLSLQPVTVLSSLPSLCEGSSVNLDLSETVSGASYELWSGGKKLSSSLTLYSDSLQVGNNLVEVKVVTPCTSKFIGSISLAKQTPAVTEIISNNACLSGAVTLKAKSVTDGDAVVWYSSAESTEPVFIGDTFTTPVLTKTSTYFVTSRSAGGCEAAREVVTATVVNFDPIQITVLPQNKLQASMTDNLQWYFNDSPIEGAVQQQINATASGIYTVRATVDGCSTEASYDFLVLGMDERYQVGIYPNPTFRFVFVERDNGDEAEIVNTLGVVVGRVEFQESGVGRTGVFDLQGYPSGIYFVRITDKKGNFEHYSVIKK